MQRSIGIALATCSIVKISDRGNVKKVKNPYRRPQGILVAYKYRSIHFNSPLDGGVWSTSTALPPGKKAGTH